MTAFKFFITARLPGRSPGPRATRLQRRLLRAATVAAQAAAVAAPTTTSSTIVRYVRHVPMAVFVDVWLLFMLINTSSIFEFNMLVAAAIMFIILELILEIMPNNPTHSWSPFFRLILTILCFSIRNIYSYICTAMVTTQNSLKEYNWT